MTCARRQVETCNWGQTSHSLKLTIPESITNFVTQCITLHWGSSWPAAWMAKQNVHQPARAQLQDCAMTERPSDCCCLQTHQFWHKSACKICGDEVWTPPSPWKSSRRQFCEIGGTHKVHGPNNHLRHSTTLHWRWTIGSARCVTCSHDCS
jgi:hypothetical protein